MSTADRVPGQVEQRSPEELRRDIEETREQLGDTVEALAEKTDVKAQARQRVDSLRGAARQKQEELRTKAKALSPQSANAGAQQVVGAAKQNPLPVAAAGMFVAGFVLGRRNR